MKIAFNLYLDKNFCVLGDKKKNLENIAPIPPSLAVQLISIPGTISTIMWHLDTLKLSR